MEEEIKKTVDASELARMMLRWEDLMEQANALGEKIKDAVFVLGETQTVGKVTAKYNTGRGSYDWRKAAEDHGFTSNHELAERYRNQVTYDYKSICDELEIAHQEMKDKYYSKTTSPSVTLSIK